MYNELDEMYCSVCHGRGLDSNDKPCPHCGGSGIEPIDMLLYEEMVLAEAN